MRRPQISNCPTFTHVQRNRDPRPLVLACALFTATLSSCSSQSPGQDESTQGDENDQSETNASTDEGTGESGSESETGEPDPIDYGAAGPHPVGNLAFELADPGGDRDLLVELWYPAAGSAAEEAALGQGIEAFVSADPDAAVFAGLVAEGPDACVRKQSQSAAAPELAQLPGPWPTLVFSHCHGCARFSSYTIAEHLASHGFLVAAVDHAGSTLFAQLADALPPLDEATLQLRADDVARVMDELLDPGAASLPEPFVGLADGARLGVYGHSFGAVTTGKILQDDPRPRAGVAMAAPIENPLLPGVTMAAIEEPLALFVAVEDNSITELGNNVLRNNFAIANTPVWKLEFADTGHFGLSDLAGLYDYFGAGCGEDERQTNGEPFTYLDPFLVRELAAGRSAAFFALHLLGDEDAKAQLEAEHPSLDVAVRE